jgi:hypothetical protein
MDDRKNSEMSISESPLTLTTGFDIQIEKGQYN